jgi:HlyD family secretion protein
MIRRLIDRRLLIAAAVFGLTAVSAAAYFANRGGADVAVATQPVTRGAVVETVSASGTVEAVMTVQVGAQVSGVVQALYADFNSIVHRGQLLARLDPQLLDSQVGQARATLVKAETEVERLQVGLEDADAKLRRAQTLADRRLVPAADLEAAQVARRSAELQLRSAEAQVLQARATVHQAEVNLEKTVIASPINGIVVSRDVDVGQTVAASMQAPTLFLIAAELTQMRVNASIDESDVGRVLPGQLVRFRVDAFPADEFIGTVAQVRLAPVVEQNVVTYQTLIAVPNEKLKLRPGMTANVTIEVARRDNVLRAPNAAVRFRPTAEMFALLGQDPPDDERSPGAGRPSDTAGRIASIVSARYEAVPTEGKAGRVWLIVGGKLTPVGVTLGASDGVYTELVATELPEGTELVTGVGVARQSTSPGTVPASNPFLGIPSGPSGGRAPSGTRAG